MFTRGVYTSGVRSLRSFRRSALTGLFLTLSCLPPLTPARAAEPDAGGAKAYIVVDAKSGHILLGSHASDRLPIASLTKIATAVVVLDWARFGNHPLGTEVAVPASLIASFQDNPIGFQAGDEVSLGDLLYASLLESDAIATQTLAFTVGRELPPVEGEQSVKGSTPPLVRFVAQMNSLARKLHMLNTRFLNPIGSDGQEKPYSTAADVARLSRSALTRADFTFFCSQKERRITLKRAGLPVSYLLRNTNELLGVKNVDGGKTGATARAGQCLMVTSERKPIVFQDGDTHYKTTRRLVVVVLGSPDRFRQASGLIDQGIEVYDTWLAAGHRMTEESTL